MKGRLELYNETINKLQQTWEGDEFMLLERHRAIAGIRSSQVAALVLMLIDMGIIKES